MSEDKSGKSFPYCLVCEKEFNLEKELESHLMINHNKWDLIQKLKKYRNNYN